MPSPQTAVDPEIADDARRYQSLKRYVVAHKLIQLVPVARTETGPFVMDMYFYGETFDAVVDSLSED